METFTINSKNHGEQEFTVNEGGGYVRCNGYQICQGGRLMGSTISIASSEDLERVARNWWKSYLRRERDM